MEKFPLVSVIIPTKNSSRNLKDSLLAIQNQTYPNVEIIVVDNFSTDDTVRIAKEFTKNVYRKGPERATQVNFGVSKAKGEYVYYTGSDVVAEKELIFEAVEACKSKKADAVYMNILTTMSHPTIWQKVRALERECYFKEPGMSGARFWKKRVFENLGGFEGILGDEIEFQSRLDTARYKTVFIDAKENNLGEYASYLTIVKRSIYYGWLIRKLQTINKRKLGKQYTPIRSEFIKHKDILLRDKVIFLYFLIYKVTQYVCAGLGYTLAVIFRYNRRIEILLNKMNYG